MARDIIPIRSVVRPDFDFIKKDIFRGESGGDYDALFNYQNRPGGLFDDTKVSEMTVDQALNFASPQSGYGNYVKMVNPEGVYSTPMGAYQVVGNTLKMAKNGLGLSGDEKMTPALQDRIGKYIYDVQGTDAWAGYRGPRHGPKPKGYEGAYMMDPDPQNEQKAQPGIMGLIQAGGRAVKEGLQNGDLMDRLALGFNTMRLEPDANLAAGIRESMARRSDMAATAGSANRTVAMLRNMKGPDGKPIPSALQAADLIEGGGPPGAILQSFYQSQNKASTGMANRDYPNGLSVVTQNDGTKKYMKNGVVLTDPTEIEAAVQDTIRYDSELAGSNRQAVLNQDRASDIYSKIGLSRKSIQTTDRAIAAIDAGGISGFMADYFPSITQASAELANAMDTMGLDVISSVTFGALSEAEMRTAMNIGSPRSLAPADLRQWLVDKKDAQQKAMAALTKAARWFSKPGNTLDGWFDQQAQAGANPAAPSNQFAAMSAQDISSYMNANLANMTTAQKAQALARLQELQRSQP